MEEFDENGFPIEREIPEEKQVEHKNRMADKFKQMNIPKPIDKSLIAASAIAGPADKVRKMQEIRMGLKRGDFAKYIEKEGVSKVASDIPVPKPKKRPGAPENPNAVKVEVANIQPVASASGADKYAELLLGGSAATSRATSAVSSRENLSLDNDDKFASEAALRRSKFASNAAQKSQTAPMVENQRPSTQGQVNNVNTGGITLGPGLIVIHEDDMKRKMANIALQVAKKVAQEMIKPLQEMVKDMLTEIENKKSGVVSSATKPGQVKVVGEGVILIDGVYYKKAKKVNE